MSKKKNTICIFLLAITTIAFLPCLIIQKEKQEFTEPNEMLAVFLGEEKSNTFPTKDDGYVYDHTECTNTEEATWNADEWKLTISKIKKETKCNVYFSLGFEKQEFAFTGAAEEFTIPVTGNYKLEVWGAQGGGIGGKGGYSVGIVHLEKNELLYVSVGEYGGNGATYKETFNGGGAGVGESSSNPRGNGGGATDIRIGENTLYHRVIVAGGGGGKAGSNAGGEGGGAKGISGITWNTTTHGDDETSAGGMYGSEYAAGTHYTNWSTNWSRKAAFGLGGSSTNSTTIAGGGGGWYGGAMGNAGGGGSGWIYTETAFNTWQTGNPTDATNWKLETKYYLTEAQTIAGNASIPTHDGTSTMTGNSGDGFAKITLVR